MKNDPQLEQMIQESEEQKLAIEKALKDDAAVKKAEALSKRLIEIRSQVDLLKAAGAEVTVNLNGNLEADKCWFETGPADNRWHVAYDWQIGEKGIRALLDQIKVNQQYARDQGIVPVKEPKPVAPPKV